MLMTVITEHEKFIFPSKELVSTLACTQYKEFVEGKKARQMISRRATVKLILPLRSDK